MTPPRAILRFWDWVPVFVLALPAMVLCSYIMGGALDLYDEGIHFLSGAMFRDGLVPYVDFYPLFPPIWTYAHLLVESVFGHLIIVQRLWFVVQGCVVVVVCHALLRSVSTSRFIPLLTTAMAVAVGFDPFWLPRWSGARLAVYLLFWLAYRRYATSTGGNRALKLFGLGLFVGASNLYAFDVGIHLTAAGAFMAVVEVPGVMARGSVGEALQRLGACVAGFLLPLVLWALYLAASGALAGYVVTYYYHYMVLLMPISTEILSGGTISIAQPRVVLLLLYCASLFIAGAYLLVSGWLGEGHGVRGVPLLAIALSLIAGISTVRAIEGTQYQMFAFIPLLLWTGFCADRAAHAIGASATISRAGGVAIAAAAFAVLFPFYAGNAASRVEAARMNVKVARFATSGDERLAAAFSKVSPLYGTFDRRFDEIAAYLAERTRPGDAILAFPMYVEMLPALAGRHSATRYPVPILVMGTAAGQQAYIDDIERERPRYMVFYPAAQFGDIAPVEPYFRPVYRYMIEHYRPAPDFPRGSYQQIWVRVD